MDKLTKLVNGKFPFYWDSSNEKRHIEMFRKIYKEAYLEGYNARIAEEKNKEEAIRFALNIVDLWSVSQHGTVSADHEGEMQALSQMEAKFKAALNL